MKTSTSNSPPTKDEQRTARHINEFASAAHTVAKDVGWWTNAKGRPKRVDVPKLLCLIHSEISEALGGHRRNLMDDKLTHRKMIEVELADTLIRIGDLAGALGLDLGGAVVEKMAFNQTRPDHQAAARRQANGKRY